MMIVQMFCFRAKQLVESFSKCGVVFEQMCALSKSYLGFMGRYSSELQSKSKQEGEQTYIKFRKTTIKNNLRFTKTLICSVM